MPKVTVLMSVYNNEKFLKQAIASILAQTFTDFEFLIIDDASADNSSLILREYTDPRIKVLTNKNNLGLASSLNIGLQQAKGEYIARMDADDISLPDRLQKQVAFMEKNPDLVLSGGTIKFIHNDRLLKYPLKSDDCAFSLLFGNCLAHPTALLKREWFLDKNLLYNPDYKRCQDYELWTRVAQKGKIANIPETVLLYRVSPEALKKHQQSGQEYPILIRKKYLKDLGVDFTDGEYNLHQKISLGEKLSLKELMGIKKWFKKIKEANKKNKTYNTESFNAFLDNKYQEITSPIYLLKNLLKYFK